MFRTYSDEDLRGMRITSGKVVIRKDDGNLIGISIGGGAPLCPCLYVVQVFDNTPAARDGTLESGDEIVGVNGTNVKGKTKVEVARMIQNKSDEVVISYNKLHAEPKQGKSLDIVLKKVKHKMVESMSSSTADALGLSRAILCNDSLVKKLDELERTEDMYRGLVSHTRRVLLGYYDLVRVCKELGDEFYKIGVREPQPAANRAFCEFGEYHRQMEKFGISMLRQTKPILSDLGTYLTKAIPDTKLTIKRYADVKFEYLSYCLKVKEFDDEDYSYQALQEPLYRVETGNYEYRLILRCRADARKRFASMRSDVLVKLELLDNKHVQDIVHQLRRLMESLTEFHIACHKMFDGVKLFPIEVELGRNAFQYNTSIYTDEDAEEAEDVLDDDMLINAEDTVPESDSLIGLNFTAPSTLLGTDVQKTDMHNDNFNSVGENTSTLLMGDNEDSCLLVGGNNNPNLLLGMNTDQLLGGNGNSSLLISGDKDSGLLIGENKDPGLLIGGDKDSDLLIGGNKDPGLMIVGNNDSSILIDRNNDSGPLTNVSTNPSSMFGQNLGSSQFIAGNYDSSHVVSGDNESSLLMRGNKDVSSIIVSNTDSRNDNCNMVVLENSSAKASHTSLMSEQIMCGDDLCALDLPKETDQSFSSKPGKVIASTGVNANSEDKNYSTSNRATNEEEIDEWCLPDPEP